MINLAEADERLLINAIEGGEAVLILGAGASATCTTPQGEQIKQAGALACHLAEKAGLSYAGESLSDVLGAVVGPRLSTDQLNRILKSEYTKVIPSKELSAMLQYTWQKIYTWNIDDSLENIRGGVQRSRFYNGMIDKVASHDGLEFVQIVHLHGEALKPEHGFIFSKAEYNARLNRNANDWYRAAAADYISYTPIFIGTRLNEPIMEAELDRARPSSGAGLGAAFLISPDAMTAVQMESFRARNIIVIRANLAEFVDWLMLKTKRSVTPIDVARKVNAFAEELSNNSSIDLADVDTAQSIILHSWKAAKADADGLQGLKRQLSARNFLEGMPPTWIIAATDIPVWLEATELLYQNLSNAIKKNDRLFMVYGQSGSGKTTALMQASLRYVRENPSSFLYELRGDVKSLRRALNLIQRLHTNDEVVVYIGDAFIFGDSLAEDVLSFMAGRMTLISSARTGEWREHIERRIGESATIFEYQRFHESDYEPLINRLLLYVPAPRFKRKTPEARVAELRSSRSQLLIAMKEATESEKFTNIITKEFMNLPDRDCQTLAVLVGLGTLARSGLATATAREAYSQLEQKRTFESVLLALEGIVLSGSNKRLTARHELYVRHIIENVAEFSVIIDAIVELLRTFTKFNLPIGKTVGRQDGLLFRFLLNHNFNAELARRRNDMEAGLRIYKSFEIDFQLDGHYWLQYGQYLVEMGSLEDSLDVLKKSIQAYPNNSYAVHAYADVQLKVATGRDHYDAKTIELIGDAVKSLEELHSRNEIETDTYPLVTLSTHHIGALIKHGQHGQAKTLAAKYFQRMEEARRYNLDEPMRRARERLAHYVTLGEWFDRPRVDPVNSSTPRRRRKRS